MLPHWASDFALYTQVLSLQVSETINSILYSGISKFKIPLEKLFSDAFLSSKYNYIKCHSR